MERTALGRGLSALIPEGAQQERIHEIPIEKIKPSTYQPRMFFDEARLKELAESIREKGVIQPVLVRIAGEAYELIAGERRFRAAQRLGLNAMPAIVKEVKNEDLLEMSLVENIQREELNKMEEARAYKRLADEFGLTHESIAQKVSKDRATVSNMMRLLELPPKVQMHLEENRISMGHARCLLSVADDRRKIRLCERVIGRRLSVRETENLVRRETAGRAEKRQARAKDIHLMSAEESLQHRLGTRVRIAQGKKRGKIVIDYYSQEDLTRVLSILMPQA